MKTENNLILSQKEIDLIKICLMIADLHNLENIQKDIKELLKKFNN